MPLYFPRNEDDLNAAKAELPRDVGNEFGETVIEERKIRINSEFGNTSVVSYESNEEKPLGAFTVMHNNPDEQRKKKIKKSNNNNNTNKESENNLYYKFLQQSQQLDLSDVARLHIIYQSGKDSQGRDIIMIIGNRLPEKRAHLDRVFLYIIKTLDKIVESDYIVVYMHANMDKKSKPEFSWLEQVYNQIDTKYNSHLRAMYVVHPTFWLKLVKGFFSTFTGDTDFWNKLQYIERLIDLFEIIDPNQLVIPQDVLDFDEKENGPINGGKKGRGKTNAESIVNDL
jgi:hypothetical protein